MKFYLESVENTFKEVSSDPHGLSAQEAEARLQKYGKNKLAEGKKVTLLQRFLEQLSDPMLIILMVAAVVSGITNYLSGESPVDVFIIMFVVILNSVLGVIQESKAEKAIEALKEMSAATSKVYRDGNLVTVKSEDLVPGDVIALEAGDAVPADSRIIECASLKVEEAALTGESVPVNKKVDTLALGDQKDVPLGDRKNMLYNGTAVVYGRGKAVVVGTGMDTEMGKIATAITEASEGETPLQKKLSQLSKILTYMVLGICAFIFAFSVWRADAIDTRLVQESFMVAVSLAVAAIPEGLAAVVTIVLSIGVTKMSKRHGATSVDQYRQLGYLPEAIDNFLALLGWAPNSEQEIFSMDELVKEFSMDHVAKNPAVFDIDKLNWINQHYMRKLSRDEFYEAAKPHMIKKGFINGEEYGDKLEWLKDVVATAQQHVSYAAQVPDDVAMYFTDNFDFENEDAKNVLLAETVPEVIRLLFDKLPKLEVLDGPSVKATFKAIQKETKLGGKNVFMPIRVALTGNQHGPELAEMVPLLGLARTVSRIKNSLDKVGVKLY